jgi:hypothetical protein
MKTGACPEDTGLEETMKKTAGKRIRRALVVLAAAMAALLLLTGLGRRPTPRPVVSEANERNFAALLTDLVRAWEIPSAQNTAQIEDDLEAIKAVDRREYAMAREIAEQWRAAYLDKEYVYYYHQGGERADALEAADIPISGKHAIVVLGYELLNGEMQPELIGRCDAAAAVARSYPEALLVCSGGATGEYNPEGHTEAGLMRDYFVERCGIDPARILIDEQAEDTAQNAANTFAILRKAGVRSVTIVTSNYHQRRGQVLYRTMAEVYRLRYRYSVEFAGNYCYDLENVPLYRRYDGRVAINQIAMILELPEHIIKTLPPIA